LRPGPGKPRRGWRLRKRGRNLEQRKEKGEVGKKGGARKKNNTTYEGENDATHWPRNVGFVGRKKRGKKK